ncbi:serine hydrolase domain-containing protein [Actinoallomurus sp. CA-150999]|uniref:serine hydrolase domain-containing protein n=1 Tax=Actinoallomurus sp. CA-150999 TaxID=3239887 RepID=UPI003D8E6263
MTLNIEGFVAPGFERVAEEFERNFADRGEVGAAFAAVRDGRPVVDLWGGLADRAAARPWRQDTLQLIFSGTKGLVAVCLLMLIDRGLLGLDDLVADHWPEFAAEGKGHLRVRDVVSHQARMPGIRSPLAEADLTDPRRLAGLLAAQAPDPDPRAGLVYHALTHGWLAGELIRRVDGRTVGRFFAEEVAAPLGLDVWIGLPAAYEHRVSTLEYAPDWGTGPAADPRQLADDALFGRIWRNPPVFPADRIPWNSRAFHEAEIPGAGAIGTARSMARLYGCLAGGGVLDGGTLLGPAALEQGRSPLAEGTDPFSGDPMAYGVGFQLQTPLRALGPAPDAFGHDGAGGSVHAAWPQKRVGFSYCMNRLRDAEPVDSRRRALLTALWRSAEDR